MVCRWGFGEQKYWAVYDGDIHYAGHKALQEALIEIDKMKVEIKKLKSLVK